MQFSGWIRRAIQRQSGREKAISEAKSQCVEKAQPSSEKEKSGYTISEKEYPSEFDAELGIKSNEKLDLKEGNSHRKKAIIVLAFLVPFTILIAFFIATFRKTRASYQWWHGVITTFNEDSTDMFAMSQKTSALASLKAYESTLLVQISFATSSLSWFVGLLGGLIIGSVRGYFGKGAKIYTDPWPAKGTLAICIFAVAVFGTAMAGAEWVSVSSEYKSLTSQIGHF